jgi:Ner family transcriptional regulator
MTQLPQDYPSLLRALRARKTSLTKVAAELALTLPHVTRVAKGERTSPRVECAIAAKLDTTPEELFPERYTDAAA